MSEQFLTKAMEYIDALAKSLGVAAEYVYAMLVKQMVISGIVSSIVSVVILIALVCWAKFSYKKLVEEKEFNRDRASYFSQEELWHVVFGLTCLVGCAGMIVCLVVLAQSLMQIFNPEYYALKEILNAVGGK